MTFSISAKREAGPESLYKYTWRYAMTMNAQTYATKCLNNSYFYWNETNITKQQKLILAENVYQNY